MKNKKGFTLIELLVVIAIIGLLSTLAVVSLGNARQKARDVRRMADMRAMQSAIELYITENNAAPTVAASWAALGTTLSTEMPGGAPEDPGLTTNYVYCVDATDTDAYLVGAVLETTDAVASDLDGISTTFTVDECIVSNDAAPSEVVNCTDTTGGNLDGDQTTTVFCLGQL